MPGRVVVAMSGGVDSSVAAALLSFQGWEVIGITMCFNLPDAKTRHPRCCGLSGIEDARRVAHRLGIRHYVLNMQKALNEYVIKDFCLEYLKGRTPNPCIRCNQYLKFDALLKKSLSLGAGYLATGHYARIRKTKFGYQLLKARDINKDQSYFLYRLGQRQLGSLLFPLGDYRKDEVRNMAKGFKLAVADKLESQEICFLPERGYREFLKAAPDSIKKWVDTDIQPGPIYDRAGNLLGEHNGIPFYTIGQRQGLGIARGYPLYVTEIRPKKNAIIVGKKKEAMACEFLVKQPHFLADHLKKKVALKVKIRYNHKEASAWVIPAEGKLKVKFKKAQFAITPGQSAVFYDKNRVVGGGIIDRVQGI